MIAVFRREDLQVQGQLAVFEDRGTSGQSVLRNFCGNCGSPIYSDAEQGRERGMIYIKAGTLDDISSLKPSTHYWTKSAHAWYSLPSDVQLLDEQ